MYTTYPKELRCGILLIVWLVAVSFGAFASGKKGVQVIRNDFYSVSIPEVWKPYQDSNGTIPEKRSIRFYHLYNIMWTRSVNSQEELERITVFSVITHQRKDDKPITLEEVIVSEEDVLNLLKEKGATISLISEKKTNASTYEVIIKKRLPEMGGMLLIMRQLCTVSRSIWCIVSGC